MFNSDFLLINFVHFKQKKNLTKIFFFFFFSMEKREKIVESWHQRAKSYEELLQQYPIFSDMTISMIHFLQEQQISNESMKIIDLAAGTGLVSRLLIEYLHISPKQLVLIEPAEQMCEIARKFLPEVQIYRQTAENCLSIVEFQQEHQFDCILSNASMHLMSDETIFPIVDRLLKVDRGFFLYTLWFHSFDETETYHNDNEFYDIVNRTLTSFGFPIYYSLTDDNRTLIRSRKTIEQTAEKNHLRFHSATIFQEKIPMKFNFDFSRMSNDWLNEHLTKYRPTDNNEDILTIKSKIFDSIEKSIEGKISKIAFVRIILTRE